MFFGKTNSSASDEAPGMGAASIVLRRGQMTPSSASPLQVVLRCGACALSLFASVGVLPQSAQAAETDRARERATSAVSDVEEAAGRLQDSSRPPHAHRPTELLASAELHLRTKQYAPAIDKLSKVVELRRQGKASASLEADAQYLLGEAYFATGELYSARRHFEAVTNQAENPAYAALGGSAASRLVDIALQVQRLDTLPDVLSRVERMLARSSNDSLRYARAKALFAMGRFEEARDEASTVVGDALFSQRAAYLKGTALMREAQDAVGMSAGEAEKTDAVSNDAQKRPDYRLAIAAFQSAVGAASGSADAASNSSRISDLAWLAVARLHYASANYAAASAAFEKIPRSSEYFSEALFELSWTYVKLGQYQRAQRLLEALAVLEPDLITGADAELLRGDLLLRAGRFNDAQTAYEEVRAKYDPLREQVHEYLEEHDDPATYYDKLTAAEIETGHELPALAIKWAREEAREERVFAIVDDVARSRELIKRSRRIVTLLRASLSTESRAKVFPEVQGQLEETLSLLNQLAIARLTLARGMDDVASGEHAGLAPVRAERRKLMARLGALPTNAGDFSVREADAEKTWNQVSQSLQRLQLEADHLKALVNGLRRMVREAGKHGVTTDPATVERFQAEIAENEKDLAVYFSRIEELRRQVEIGRVQAGFGDERFVEDDRVRERFNKVFEQEVALSAGGADPEAQSYASSIGPLLTRIQTIEGRLRSLRSQLNSSAKSRGEEMQAIVDTEAQAIEAFASKLDTMDQHARLLVGEVAHANFVKARDRIKDVVMRSDVGLVQQAWEVREEQRYRVRDLLRERAREERFINDELREVLDDSEEGGQ